MKRAIVTIHFVNGSTAVDRRFYVVYSSDDRAWRWVLGDQEVKDLAAGTCG